LPYESPDALLVPFRPDAALFSGSQQQLEMVFVDDVQFAVNPAEAKRLLDDVHEGNSYFRLFFFCTMSQTPEDESWFSLSHPRHAFLSGKSRTLGFLLFFSVVKTLSPSFMP